MEFMLLRSIKPGWMKQELVWMEKVWSNWPDCLLRKNAYLVWDPFSAHRTDNTKNLAREMNTALAVIPGGLTSQPLDVSINKLFKNNMRVEG